MANGPALTQDQNLLPVQAYFDLQGNFQTFIGQNKPFYASINPIQSGLTITNSTIDSTTIGATNPSTGSFTNITTVTGQISSAPSNGTDITNKTYVDNFVQGLNAKAAVVVATTANITLSGIQTIDGYTTLAGDRVLVKNQSLSQNNGIYIASASAWTRSPDMDTWAEVPSAYMFVMQGTTQQDTSWLCTSDQGGTLGVTPITFVQFGSAGAYTAGTGLTLTANQFSITNTSVTAGSYGSGSSVATFTVNAQGQLTAAASTAIAIANTQVSGLGTMSTQNANSVAITGGSINGTTIGASSAGAITGTTITANSSFSGAGTGLTGLASGLSIGGNAATATSATSAGSVTNSLTFNNGGAGAVSGSTFNGASALTVSYNTVGAPSTSGTGASGTWGISVTGNAGTVTNGVYTTGSYSNPTWITSILGSIVSGAVASATTATNVAGGTTGAIAYQSGAGATTFLTLGTTNYVLTAGASAPQYVAQSTLSVGSASTATTSTNLAGGVAGAIPWQSAASTTGFTAAGTTGQVLTSNGTSVPTWTTPAGSVSLSDDTTTNATRYPLFAAATSGSVTTEYTSSTKYQYNPSTGTLTASVFSGAGTGLTGTATSLSIGGNAATATSATSATTATTATNLAGGANGSVPYQTGSGATTFLAAGTNGYILTLAGGVPTWAAAPATGITITDDTTTNATRYLTFTSATSGSITGENTSSTKLQYNPSTGAFTSPQHIATATVTGSSSQGAFAYGTLTYSDVNHLATFQTSVNGYSQVEIQNSNSGASASADMIVSNNLTTSTTYYGDFGINSSAFSGTGSLGLPNATYLTATTGDLSLGTTTSNSIHFVIGGSATDAMTINTSGALALNGSYGTAGYVLTSQGSGSAPTWAASSGGLTISTSSSNSTFYLPFTSATSGSISSENVNTSIKVNPSTGDLSAPQHVSTNGLQINANTNTTSYTIATGQNAMSVGPFTTAGGTSITVPSGSRWIIL